MRWGEILVMRYSAVWVVPTTRVDLPFSSPTKSTLLTQAALLEDGIGGLEARAPAVAVDELAADGTAAWAGATAAAFWKRIWTVLPSGTAVYGTSALNRISTRAVRLPLP